MARYIVVAFLVIPQVSHAGFCSFLLRARDAYREFRAALATPRTLVLKSPEINAPEAERRWLMQYLTETTVAKKLHWRIPPRRQTRFDEHLRQLLIGGHVTPGEVLAAQGVAVENLETCMEAKGFTSAMMVTYLTPEYRTALMRCLFRLNYIYRTVDF